MTQTQPRACKPGDVVTMHEHGIGLVVAFNEFGCPAGHERYGVHVHLADGDWSGLADLRRLVVIDPDDREQVERLATAYLMQQSVELDNEQPMTVRELRMRAALREFANPTPPRPEEPTGLGAVVEDDKGHKFVHVADSIDGWWVGRAWQRIGGDVNAVRNFGWSDIAAVRVLCEGVPA